LEKQLGHQLPDPVQEQQTAEEEEEVKLEESLFDPRGPGAAEPGDVAFDGPLPGVPVTTL
jgi:hypothetical protein